MRSIHCWTRRSIFWATEPFLATHSGSPRVGRDFVLKRKKRLTGRSSGYPHGRECEIVALLRPCLAQEVAVRGVLAQHELTVVVVAQLVTDCRRPCVGNLHEYVAVLIADDHRETVAGAPWARAN